MPCCHITAFMKQENQRIHDPKLGVVQQAGKVFRTTLPVSQDERGCDQANMGSETMMVAITNGKI